MQHMTNHLIFIVFDVGVQVIEICLRLIVFIEIQVSPSFPEITNHIKVFVALVVNKEFILVLPTLLSSHIVAYLEAKHQLKTLQGTILKSVIVKQELSYYLAPFGALSSRIHKVIAIVGKQSTEIYHSRLDKLFQLLLLWNLLAKNIKCHFIEKQMANYLISTCISLVVHIRLILHSQSFEESLEDIRKLSLSKVQHWMFIFTKIIEKLCVAHNCLSFIWVVLKEQTSSRLSILFFDYKSACPIAIQLSFSCSWSILQAITTPILFHKRHRSVFLLSSQKVVFFITPCIYTIESNSISRTTWIAIR